MLSLVTASRTQELGIRAGFGRIARRSGAAGGWCCAIQVLAGIVVGLAGAVGLARFIRSMLFATSPIDVSNLLQVTALFLVVALAACLAPAWRAARVDPISSLREQ